jgi:hypothetical protein
VLALTAIPRQFVTGTFAAGSATALIESYRALAVFGLAVYLLVRGPVAGASPGGRALA